MNTLDKRLSRLGAPALPASRTPNPLTVLVIKLLAARPDQARLHEEALEYGRTGRLPGDPLLRAALLLAQVALDAEDAGLFASAYGESLCQQADREFAELCEVAAMTEDEAAKHVAKRRIMDRVIADWMKDELVAEWPALSQRAARDYVTTCEDTQRQGDKEVEMSDTNERN